ncbi:MAG: hypothetical protein HYV28_06050 [Ignavibacteriales bacterium]|nr:hypothetical protein [Ignavibacteriales bacterium]
MAAQSEGKKSTEYIKVVSSSEKQIILSCDFNNAFWLTDTIITGRQYAYFSGNFTSCRIPGEPWLPQEFVPFGVPEGSTAEILLNDMQTEELHNIFLLPYPEVEGKLCTEPESFSRDVYSANRYFPESPVSISKQMQSRYLTFRNLSISPYIYNPVQRSMVFYKKFTVTITIKGGEFGKKVTSDAFTESLLTGTVINPKESRSFLVSPEINVNKAVSAQKWYQPGMDYYKMFIHQKGIYKIDYPAMLAAGIQPLGKPLNKIAVYMGQSIIPIDISDKNTNGIFDEDDFFVFVGTPPPPTPYCTQNIYQSANVCFITFNANDITGGRYNLVNSTVSVPGQIQSVYKRTDFYEIDQIFERLGHAGDDKRDFWFWGIADAMNNVPGRKFLVNFSPLTNLPTDSHLVSIQVKMHGMTNYNCGFDHHAVIKINGKKIGEAIWSGQTEYLYSGSFYVSSDSVQILPTGNIIEVIADGQTCRPEDGDEFRVNWFSFSYPSKQIAVNGKLTFDSPLNSNGIVRYETSGWSNDSVQVLCPHSHKKFTNLLFNAGTITFTDSVISPSEYYGAAAGNYLSVDSIKKDVSSDLRNSANGADYLIIAHRQFTQIAERLKNIRSANFPDKLIPSPRISIIYVDDIYDEFSSGLQDPKAIQQFIAFTFSNWRSPAPAYAVLIGDMSSDYRQLLPTSRKNFIPSLDVMSFTYGIAASDNAFACIMGDDVLPDLALGRISIETVAEGNIILDKLEHYPADTGKEWKNKGMMFASGMSEKDEADYGFNDESMMLKQNYLDAGGAFSKVIFRYPNKDIYQQYQGATEAMRNAISDGGVLLNYYGHGGGFQWDMVFSDDDIYLLNNQGRLPLVLSVTCYTGHFDNNDIFGEQFNKVEGKGSIGFFGSSGLTNWESGRYINNFVFDEIFTQKNYLTGKVFMKAKIRTPVNSWYGNQILLC